MKSRIALTSFLGLFVLAATITRGATTARPAATTARTYDVREVNDVARPEPNSVLAIVGATLIDGRGGAPVADATVVVRGNKIEAVGPRGQVKVPAGARVIDATGQTLLPGLVDAHFHGPHRDFQGPLQVLRRGITSFRDPGKWLESYEAVRTATQPVPRLFLTGPFLDTFPSAHPHNAYIARDADEVTAAVNRFVDQGASAIKVYYRLPLALIRATTAAAHARGVPVTAHLELVDADLAIEAGLDGIEHITSLSSALIPGPTAEKFRHSVMADNSARTEGRIDLWSRIDPNGREADALIDLMVNRQTFLCPTLAVFERRRGGLPHTETYLKSFANMQTFLGRAARAGVKIVTGSHAQLSHRPERGWDYHYEMELLAASGLSPMQIIIASTSECARFLGIDRRLGTVEPGKEADLLLVAGDPLADISAMRAVRLVVLNGRAIE